MDGSFFDDPVLEYEKLQALKFFWAVIALLVLTHPSFPILIPGLD